MENDSSDDSDSEVAQAASKCAREAAWQFINHWISYLVWREHHRQRYHSAHHLQEAVKFFFEIKHMDTLIL